MLKGKPEKEIDENEIQPNELQESGIEIQRGDSRLKEGIRRDNLSADERRKLDEMRKKKKSSS